MIGILGSELSDMGAVKVINYHPAPDSHEDDQIPFFWGIRDTAFLVYKAIFESFSAGALEIPASIIQSAHCGVLSIAPTAPEFIAVDLLGKGVSIGRVIRRREEF
jgi:hypothetical protein